MTEKPVINPFLPWTFWKAVLGNAHTAPLHISSSAQTSSLSELLPKNVIWEESYVSSSVVLKFKISPEEISGRSIRTCLPHGRCAPTLVI